MKISPIFVFFAFLIIFLPALTFGQETLNITTYYPSPYGSYNELQLMAHASPVATCSGGTGKGTMYYNSGDDKVMVCNGAAWNPLGNSLGAWSTKTFGTNYLAATDGMAVAYVRDNFGACPSGTQNSTVAGYTDAANPPTTLRTVDSARREQDVDYATVTLPVRKGDYFRVSILGGAGCTEEEGLFWIPTN